MKFFRDDQGYVKQKQNKWMSGLVGVEFQDRESRWMKRRICRPTWSPPVWDGKMPHASLGQLLALTRLSDKRQTFKIRRCTSALSVTCSNFCPVPGRLHGTLSYSGARMSCHYRVGGHWARSGGRFTLKAIAKGGTVIRREKKRSIKESVVFNSETLRQNILEQNRSLVFLGKS